MKNGFFLISLLLLAVSCQKPENKPPQLDIPCLPDHLDSSVIAFYPFSNGSINDLSGHNNHLVNNTSARHASDRNGNGNCAFNFSKSSHEFLTTNKTNFLNGLGQFSVSLWYRPLDTSINGGDIEVLISRDKGISCPNRHGQWSLILYECRRAAFGRQNSVWDTLIIYSDTGTCKKEVLIRTGSWHHVAATYDGSKKEMKIYRDGVLQESDNTIATCSSGIPSYQDIGDLFIGKAYTGDIDDIIIYKKVLSDQDIKDLYALEPCCK